MGWYGRQLSVQVESDNDLESTEQSHLSAETNPVSTTITFTTCRQNSDITILIVIIVTSCKLIFDAIQHHLSS